MAPLRLGVEVLLQTELLRERTGYYAIKLSEKICMQEKMMAAIKQDIGSQALNRAGVSCQNLIALAFVVVNSNRVTMLKLRIF